MYFVVLGLVVAASRVLLGRDYYRLFGVAFVLLTAVFWRFMF